MRVGIATVRAPFISGGAEIHAENLLRAVREAGHTADIISMPCRFFPAAEVSRSMDVWESEFCQDINGYSIDATICLKFPSFYLQHSNKVLWVIHQFRAVYDLWDTPFSGDLPHTAAGQQLRTDIIARDNKAFESCSSIWTVSQTVSDRLRKFNTIDSKPLYHPPLAAEQFYCASPEPYVFFPSRFETLKRQELLIEAMQLVKAPVVAVLSGNGGQKENLQRLVEQLDLGQRVYISEPVFGDELRAWYAHSLAVFCGPKDEDYGYVTLEAMLSEKPVITCTDSGGPLEFVCHEENGLITEARAESIADAIERLYRAPNWAAAMGKAGRSRYLSLDISWPQVVNELLGTTYA